MLRAITLVLILRHSFANCSCALSILKSNLHLLSFKLPTEFYCWNVTFKLPAIYHSKKKKQKTKWWRDAWMSSGGTSNPKLILNCLPFFTSARFLLFHLLLESVHEILNVRENHSNKSGKVFKNISVLLQEKKRTKMLRFQLFSSLSVSPPWDPFVQSRVCYPLFLSVCLFACFSLVPSKRRQFVRASSKANKIGWCIVTCLSYRDLIAFVGCNFNLQTT